MRDYRVTVLSTEVIERYLNWLMLFINYIENDISLKWRTFYFYITSQHQNHCSFPFAKHSWIFKVATKIKVSDNICTNDNKKK